MSEFNNVLDFWFGPAASEGYGRARDAWFRKDPGFDARIRAEFLDLYERADAGQCDAWGEEPDSALALAVVLDQFPRNMFRGTPRSFASDGRALAVARNALARDFDRGLLPVQRWFIYLP